MTSKAKLITILHQCFECHKSYTSPQLLRTHMAKHEIHFPNRVTGVRRYSSQEITYVKAAKPHDEIEMHFGCPACIAHYIQIGDLKTHYYASHPETIAEQSQASQTSQVSQASHTSQPSQTSQVSQASQTSQVSQASQTSQVSQASQTSPQETAAVEQQQQQLNKRRLSSVIGTELLDASSLVFPPPDHDDHFLLNAFDATTAFYELQRSLSHHKWKLSLEDNICCAMAATHILLLSPNQYPQELQPHFSSENIKAAINAIETKYEIKRLPMSMTTTTRMLEIISNLQMEILTRDKAIAQLLDLELPTIENKFKQCIMGLIRKLPPVPISDDINESELSSRYIDPFLSGLFDDPDEGTYLRWTNEITLEARQDEDLSTKRPDLCISRLHGMTWAANHGYGEAKSAAQGGSNYLICRDLLRVGIFCKNALDAHNMEGVLGLQVIGRTVTFYLLVLPSTGLYVMYELEKIRIPGCLSDLTKLIVDMPRVCRVLDTFNRICQPSSHQAMPSRHRPTITTSAFNGVFSLSQEIMSFEIST